MANRDNGFVAQHYAMLADLDPRLADAMLAVLRAAGIAAYVVPSTGSIGGYLDVRLPERPRDRLWVDREQHDRAAALLAEHTGMQPATVAGEPPTGEPLTGVPADAETPAGQLTDDEVWAQLVADFELPAYEQTWPGSADERLPASFEQPDTPVPRRVVRPADRPDLETAPEPVPPADNPPVPAPAPAPAEFDILDLLDEHFVPPIPPKPPAVSMATRWAIAAIVIGLVLVVLSTSTPLLPNGSAYLGAACIVGGFVSLVAHMRDERPDDGGSDDGAVV